MNASNPLPEAITLHQQSAVLEVAFTDGVTFHLPCEYLRVYSPSAEVRGHHADQAVLQVGKRQVQIIDLETVGHYALRLSFSDGHHTGLYTWAYLYELGEEQANLWQQYLDQLQAAGASRDE